MSEPWTGIGDIRSVQPGRREVRIVPRPGRDAAFDGFEWLHVRSRGAETPKGRYRVAAAEWRGSDVVATLAMGVPMDAVRDLKGGEVVVEMAALPKRADEWPHIAEWIGWRVIDAAGHDWGEITEVYETPANDAFSIRQANGRLLTAPVLPEMVQEVDPDAGKVYVTDLAPYMDENAD